jgi:hypothetical protein
MCQPQSLLAVPTLLTTWPLGTATSRKETTMIQKVPSVE